MISVMTTIMLLVMKTLPLSMGAEMKTIANVMVMLIAVVIILIWLSILHMTVLMVAVMSHDRRSWRCIMLRQKPVIQCERTCHVAN